MHLQSAQTLRAVMAQHGLSIRQVADDASCSSAFISHLLAGRKTSCTPALAERIAEAVRAPIDLLFVAEVSTSPRRTVSAPAPRLARGA